MKTPFTIRFKKSLLALTTALTFGAAALSTAQDAPIDPTDMQLWAYVQQLDNADAYAAYLAANPNGAFADLARSSLQSFALAGQTPSDDVSGIQEVVVEKRKSILEMLGFASSDETEGGEFERTFEIAYAG